MQNQVRTGLDHIYSDPVQTVSPDPIIDPDPRESVPSSIAPLDIASLEPHSSEPPLSSLYESIVDYKVSVSMSVGSSKSLIFEGFHGENPLEYIEDVEDYADTLCGGDPNHPKRDYKLRSTFRNGLKGDAKDWYQGVQLDSREDWDALTTLFKDRFKVKIGKGNPELAAAIDFFEKKSGEKLSLFLARAMNLSRRANPKQLEKLRNRTYKKSMPIAISRTELSKTELRIDWSPPAC